MPNTMPNTMRRTMRRNIIGALAAGLLAAGALIAPSVASTATAMSVPQCTNADLKASHGRSDGAAGTIYVRIRLRNVSGHACRTGGYGGVSLVGHGDGTQIGAAAVRLRGRVRTIVLQPGQSVRSVVGVTQALNYPRRRCHPVHADGFRVYAPNQTASQFVRYSTTGCGNPRIHLLRQQPYRR